ncbi:Sulfurtransferase TusA [Pigmentiphaga humi]|uniref:Sulfurtransferase TusA n=1 Tax=Pigmentiphaga humi TaxID=2478468 RepID=A0A3P4AZ21_9BURK|nr:sulfurtransferase TusA family protein [Pigmentiphaga humi]VCU68648.1 Sulfurtransferase TusA [Pigmentiphaga humi]
MTDTPLPVPAGDIAVADTWDAGDMGCGALVSRLRRRLRAMPGQVLYMVTRDAGAPEDIPAWCRMTRNELLRYDAQAHGFWIRSRLDW